MNKPNNDSLEKIGCDALNENHGKRVVIRRDMRKDFDTLEVRKKARLIAIMDRWCQGLKMTPEMFNANEGRTTRNNIMLQAFKATKVRFYGVDTTIEGRRMFIIFDADTAKKQNKANPTILKRAKTRVDKFFDDFTTKE